MADQSPQSPDRHGAADGNASAGEGHMRLARIEQRNKFRVGDAIEIMKPEGSNVEVTVEAMYDSDCRPVESCPHARQQIWLRLSHSPEPYDLLRVRNL